ncbi:IPT/TIG domain-containing protein [Candidatus Sumerlaeota bacterium]|nr:IPT/TIG domain-containing protein [Candidatus Sumerlaeota bacterium]
MFRLLMTLTLIMQIWVWGQGAPPSLSVKELSLDSNGDGHYEDFTETNARDSKIWHYEGDAVTYQESVPLNLTGVTIQGTHFLNRSATVVTVGKEGCDFTSIQSAIDSITDSSPTKPYVVMVYPGCMR